MDHVDREDVERRMGPAADKRALAAALGTAELALNYYELDPGDSFGFGYHRHPDQEEVFYVIEGTATFETEDGDVAVSAGEAVRFAPGEWQLGRNAGDERVVALAMGAPKDAGRTEMLRECPDCGGRTEGTVEMADDREALVTRCTDCGAETGRFT
ncbi:cupin domain-containing protein [Halosimplex litoreum]|uniref:Cupin domain-containing protein n=1 Tax=Halosimplex litoreum TaxID=1198301 RepID=A0A7T3FV89_9EURY|nr:cupin domain-containing protein [Halosimplex litoreum]QPV61366.1 cupin domain-containing protein [Halosimplex litoreum]